jgi:hypothetical protein
MFDLFFSFAPWIVFSSLNRSVSFAVAIGLAVLAAAAVLIRSKVRGSVHLLDLASFGYFVLLLGGVLVLSPSASELDTWSTYMQTGSYAALAIIVFGSIAVRRPFTLSYAKEGVPEEFWTTDVFLKINDQISARWGAAFAVGAVSTAIAASTDAFPIILHGLPYVAMYLAYRFTQKASSDGAADDDTVDPAITAS